jgi:hypothetical protein
LLLKAVYAALAQQPCRRLDHRISMLDVAERSVSKYLRLRQSACKPGGRWKQVQALCRENWVNRCLLIQVGLALPDRDYAPIVVAHLSCIYHTKPSQPRQEFPGSPPRDALSINRYRRAPEHYVVSPGVQSRIRYFLLPPLGSGGDGFTKRRTSTCPCLCSEKDFSRRNSTCLLRDRRSRFAISANFIFSSEGRRTNRAAL